MTTKAEKDTRPYKLEHRRGARRVKNDNEPDIPESFETMKDVEKFCDEHKLLIVFQDADSEFHHVYYLPE